MESGKEGREENLDLKPIPSLQLAVIPTDAVIAITSLGHCNGFHQAACPAVCLPLPILSARAISLLHQIIEHVISNKMALIPNSNDPDVML